MEEDNRLYRVVTGYIDKAIINTKNRNKLWKYGYDSTYDLVIISKDGTLGEIYEIEGVHIGLPLAPASLKLSDKLSYWQPKEYPKELFKLKKIFDWERMDNAFKHKWTPFIDEEYDNRELGHFFNNQGLATYVTGSHYMYLQWSKIDVGLPDFRDSNRIFFIYWEACKADNRCYGMCYVKNRRSGFSFMASSETANVGTLASDSRLGICSKTGGDAKKMFTDKVVPIVNNYPFFFSPIRDGMTNPKMELAFRVPASKITKKNMGVENTDDDEGLDTTIDWSSTDDNSYDGEKLILLIEDEAGKLEKPNNILNGWRVRKTCLRLGAKIIGKCMMGSTLNALAKGGSNYKQMYLDSNPRIRSKNGQTKSGMYSLFIPMEHNFEGYIDKFGHPVLEDPKEPIEGIDGELIDIGVISYWNNELDSYKGDADAQNEFYRQYPRTTSHAFRDEAKQSLFNLTKIYSQIDYNDSLVKEKFLTKGYFHWKEGVLDSEVIWTPDKNGPFLVSWLPPLEMRNNKVNINGQFHPGNEHIGAFGCDSYDISGVVGGGGSKGALHGRTKWHMSNAPVGQFFLEYIHRPLTADIMFEEVLMACVFYGMPMLAENNKARLLYHFKNRGYRKFALNRPDKKFTDLSVSEREIGGVPNSSEDMKQAHASAIESFVEEFVGLDDDGHYRDIGSMGDMFFNRTLEDWAAFDINNRTKYDASISSGLAIMATRKHIVHNEVKKPKNIIKFARYNNDGNSSQLNK